MEEISNLLMDRCKKLIIKINLIDSEKYASLPLIRYILSIPCSIPVEHIILAERPYSTDIFPYAASAMSYNADLEINPTPIVHFLALDVSNASDLEYETCKNWFRDSWKYLNNGILLLNVCTTHSFMDSKSERERVAMEEFIRDIISVSLKLSDIKIHIYALGNPARHSAGRIRSSIVESKNKVVIHDCKNPASFKHKLGDTMSPNFTMGYKSITKLLTRLIKDTIKSNSVLSDYSYWKMSTGISDLNRLKEKSVNSRDTFKEIAAYFKTNTGKLVERHEDLFNRAAEEMTEFISALSATKIQLLFTQVSEPQGTAKPAYFNQRSNYNNSNYGKGSSSRASVQTPGKKQVIGFADDDTPEENPNVESGTNTLVNTSIRTKHAGSVAAQSSTTRRTVSIGFADDDDDDEPIQKNINKVESIKLDINKGVSMLTVSDDEIADLSLISDFIDPANDDYDYTIEPAILEFIHECIRTRRASSKIAEELINIIRNIRTDSRQRSVKNALGYEDSIIDMGSPIMQWIINNAPRS